MTTPSAPLNMALSQLLTNSVLDQRILNAMVAVPRSALVPPAFALAAYADGELPLGGGRFLPDPLSFARLLQAAEIQPQDKVLDVGCAYGYSTAVIAQLARYVTACESDRLMAEGARRNVDALGIANARIAQVAELTEGYAADGPYDAIIVEGALQQTPASLLRLLAPGGRLVMASALDAPRLGSSGIRARLCVYVMEGAKPYRKDTIEMTMPLLAGAANVPFAL